MRRLLPLTGLSLDLPGAVGAGASARLRPRVRGAVALRRPGLPGGAGRPPSPCRAGLPHHTGAALPGRTAPRRSATHGLLAGGLDAGQAWDVRLGVTVHRAGLRDAVMLTCYFCIGRTVAAARQEAPGTANAGAAPHHRRAVL